MLYIFDVISFCCHFRLVTVTFILKPDEDQYGGKFSLNKNIKPIMDLFVLLQQLKRFYGQQISQCYV